ncbi:MAG: S-layer homology domain-containing protein [Bacillota bacterium]
MPRKFYFSGLLIFICLLMFAGAAWAADFDSVIQEKIDGGVDFLHDEFTKNRKSIDLLGAEALVKSGENLDSSKWSVTWEMLIREEAKNLDENSPAAVIAKNIIALDALGDSQEEITRLAGLFKDIQGEDGNFGTSVYEHVWPIMALNQVGLLNDEYLDVEKAKEWLLRERLESGVWGYSWDGMDINDVDATNWAMRALDGFPAAGEEESPCRLAIEDGLEFLKTQQGEKGEIANWDAGVSTGETVLTLLQLGIDPTGADWTITDAVYGYNPITYLLSDEAQNGDGSFGPLANVGGTIVPLNALIAFQDSSFNSGEGDEMIDEKILAALDFLYDEFSQNRKSIDLLEAEALVKSGEDLDSSKWSVTWEMLIREEAKNLDENSPSTVIAKNIIVLDALGGSQEEITRLAGLFKDMQGEDGNFGTSVYEHVWPIMALNQVGLLNDEYLDVEKAKEWLLRERLDSGVWGYSWDGMDTNDVDATNWAMRALTGFADGDEGESPCRLAIEEGLEFLKTQQGEKGEIANWDAGVSTGETVLTLLQLDIDPTGENWTVTDAVYSYNPITYLLSDEAQNGDGSFGPLANVGGTVVPIKALAAFKDSSFNDGSGGGNQGDNNNDDNENDNNNSSGGGSAKKISVKIAVVGEDGDILYGPRSVTLYEDDPYGMSVLGALDATGLSWSFHDDFIGFINEIDGEENKGSSGWQYKVNGKVPNSIAEDKKLYDGDKVIWWYSSASSKGPDWDDLENGKVNSSKNETNEETENDDQTTEETVRKSFADVGENWAWAKDAIEILAGRGIIEGTGTGFEPKRSITRAEFIKMLVTALELELEIKEYQDRLFQDVEAKDWFSQTVAAAWEKGIIEGDPDGRFRPHAEISRNEIAAILYRLAENRESDLETNALTFSDTGKIPAWALDGVKYAFGSGLMKGYEDNTFQGGKFLNRAEAAVVIYRYLQGVAD